MDLVTLKKHAILIPTPGQTEQEYLADFLMKKKWFLAASQQTISLTELLQRYKAFDFNPLPEIAPTYYRQRFIQKLQEVLNKTI